MNNPDIQNDFSYFRRTMSRRNMNMASVGVDYDEGRCVSTELANEMSLFYAEATPMLKTLTAATSAFVQKVLFIKRSLGMDETACKIVYPLCYLWFMKVLS